MFQFHIAFTRKRGTDLRKLIYTSSDGGRLYALKSGSNPPDTIVGPVEERKGYRKVKVGRKVFVLEEYNSTTPAAR